MTTYTTADGDRWDRISLKFYGQSDCYDEIIKANPYLDESVKKSPILSSGIKLAIPDIVVPTVYPEGVPTWKK